MCAIGNATTKPFDTVHSLATNLGSDVPHVKWDFFSAAWQQFWPDAIDDIRMPAGVRDSKPG